MCGGREGSVRRGGGILAEQIVEDLILGSSSNGGSYPVASTIVNLMKDDVCWAKEGAEGRRQDEGEGGRMGYRDRAKFEQLPAGSSGFFFCLLIIHHARTKAELGTLMNKRQVKQGNLKWAWLTGSGGEGGSGLGGVEAAAETQCKVQALVACRLTVKRNPTAAPHVSHCAGRWGAAHCARAMGSTVHLSRSGQYNLIRLPTTAAAAANPLAGAE